MKRGGVLMTETYDPKAKRVLDSIGVNGVVLKIGDRVRYIGSSPCFIGRSGALIKIRREWVSARQRSRAGFVGYPAGYALSAEVLWDGTPTSGPYAHPQSCVPSELALEGHDR